MRTAASILMLFGVIIGILGVLGGIFVAFAPRYPSQSGDVTGGITLVVCAILTWLLLYAFGTTIERIDDIAIDTRRSADALDRIAKAQTGVASSLPPDAAKRLKNSPQVESARSVEPRIDTDAELDALFNEPLPLPRTKTILRDLTKPDGGAE